MAAANHLQQHAAPPPPPPHEHIHRHLRIQKAGTNETEVLQNVTLSSARGAVFSDSSAARGRRCSFYSAAIDTEILYNIGVQNGGPSQHDYNDTRFDQESTAPEPLVVSLVTCVHYVTRQFICCRSRL
jgi:hypothetical protein